MTARLPRPRQASGRFDLGLQRDRPFQFEFGFQPGKDFRDRLDVRGTLDLRKDDGIEAGGCAAHDELEIAAPPLGAQPVDADGDRRCSPVALRESARGALASLVALRVGHDGVLKVDEHLVGCERRRLGEGALARGRDGEAGAAQAV